MTGSATTFITIPYSVIETRADHFDANEYGVNILIDTTEINTETIVSYIRQFPHHFIFSLSGKVLTDSRISIILPLLYTMFSLGSYGKSKNYIPVFHDAADSLASSLDQVKNYFSLQGEKNFEFFAILDPNKNAQAENETLICHFSHLKQIDEELFKKYKAMRIHQVILLFDQYDSIRDNIEALQLLVKTNSYAKLCLELAGERSHTLGIEHNSELWKKRANLYLSFIPLSKKIGESQYYDIVSWYKNEYEVLPVWYKRVGHILKVLTGKRSFRSLFNDNVKKYKN